MITRSKGNITDEQFTKLLNNIETKKKKKEKLDELMNNMGQKDVIEIIAKKFPLLQIKEKSEKKVYDKYDKECIKHIYGTLYEYDSGIDSNEEETDSDTEEVSYFKKLSIDKKKKYVKLMMKIDIKKKNNIPIRFKILSSKMCIYSKMLCLNKLERYRKDQNAKHLEWLQFALQIPFNTYQNFPYSIKKNTKKEISDYLLHSKDLLDRVVFGHIQAKSQIIQIVSQLITNPNSSGNVFGIHGPMGNGKTTLLKNGLAKILKRPFEIIQLGGASDSSFLTGHSFTYEGSQYGRIVDILIKTKTLNPIIYFDELDKISMTEKGKEIIGILTHITDPSQNQHYQDKYFTGINIDLSKAIFVFSFNQIEKINKILLDRINVIHTKGFKTKDKIEIAKKFLIPNICLNTGIKIKNLKFTDEIIDYIIQNFTKEEGVRTLKRQLEKIITKLNMISLFENDNYKKLNLPLLQTKISFPLLITKDHCRLLLTKDELFNDPPFGMYI